MTQISVPDFNLRIALEEALARNGQSTFIERLESLQAKQWEAEEANDEVAQKAAQQASLEVLEELRSRPLTSEQLASIDKLHDVSVYGEYFDTEWFDEMRDESEGIITDFRGLEACTNLAELELVHHRSPSLEPLRNLQKLTKLNLFTDESPPEYGDLTPLLNLPNLRSFHLPGMEKQAKVVARIRQNNPETRRIDELKALSATLEGIEESQKVLEMTGSMGPCPENFHAFHLWQNVARKRAFALIDQGELEDAHALLSQMDRSGSNRLLAAFWEAWAPKAEIVLAPVVQSLIECSILSEKQVRSLCLPQNLQSCHYQPLEVIGLANFSQQDEAWTLHLEIAKDGPRLIVKWAQLLPTQGNLKLTLASGAMENGERGEAVSHLLGLAKICHGAGLREYAARVMNEVRARFPEFRDRIKGMEDEPQTELSARLLESVFQAPN